MLEIRYYTFKSTRQNNIQNNYDKPQNSHKLNKQAVLIAASLLSLGTMCKANIDLNTINNNVERSSFTTKTDSYTPINQTRNNNESHISDEEKIHKFVMAFTLLGFFTPILLSVFDYKEPQHPQD